MNSQFDNEKRNRYYGVRVGDMVDYKLFKNTIKGEVSRYGFMDNNCVYIKCDDGKEIKAVAEWCTIIEKVEDKIIN